MLGIVAGTKWVELPRTRLLRFTCTVLVEEEGMADEALETVRGTAGRVLAEPVAREWGGRSGYFADPKDNVGEVAWMQGATFDEWGGLIWP